MISTLSSKSSAWLLDLSADNTVAVGKNVFAEYLIEPSVFAVPGAVEYCCEMLYWRERYVPVFDFSEMLNQGPLSCQHVGVFAHQRLHSEKVEYVAIKLFAQTQRVDVDDSLACDWPDDYPKILEPLARSLFKYDGRVISVLDLSCLCSDRFRDYVCDNRRC